MTLYTIDDMDQSRDALISTDTNFTILSIGHISRIRAGENPFDLRQLLPVRHSKWGVPLHVSGSEKYFAKCGNLDDKHEHTASTTLNLMIFEFKGLESKINLNIINSSVLFTMITFVKGLRKVCEHLQQHTVY